MAQLVRLRGTSKHKSGLAHDIFLGVRFSAMIYSLQHCKASVLSPRQREWNEQPWTIHLKDENQRLFDHGFTLAEILEDLVSCKKPSQDRVEVGKKMFGIVPRIYQLGQDMDDWYIEHFSGNPPPSHDSPSEAGHSWNITQSSLYDNPSRFHDIFDSLLTTRPGETTVANLLPRLQRRRNNLHLLGHTHPPLHGQRNPQPAPSPSQTPACAALRNPTRI